MRTLKILAAAVMLAMAAWVAFAQPPPQGPPPPGPGPMQQQRPPMTPEQRLDMLAERLGLTEAEKGHVATALKARMEASQQFQQEIRALRETARDPNLTEEQADAALAKFNKALEAHRNRLRSIEAALANAVSAKTRLKLTAVGIIDNGGPLGFGMMEGRRPGGMGPFGRPVEPAPAP